MLSGVAIWTIALIIWMSACDGVGSPEGWLLSQFAYLGQTSTPFGPVLTCFNGFVPSHRANNKN